MKLKQHNINVAQYQDNLSASKSLEKTSLVFGDLERS
jgi:hypothetical protein